MDALQHAQQKQGTLARQLHKTAKVTAEKLVVMAYTQERKAQRLSLSSNVMMGIQRMVMAAISFANKKLASCVMLWAHVMKYAEMEQPMQILVMMATLMKEMGVPLLAKLSQAMLVYKYLLQ